MILEFWQKPCPTEDVFCVNTLAEIMNLLLMLQMGNLSGELQVGSISPLFWVWSSLRGWFFF
jgi:hypothetical protein